MGKARRSKHQRRTAALVETRRVGDEFTVRRLGHHEDDLRLEATDLLRSVGMTDRNGDLYDPRGSTVHHNLAILSAKGASHVRRAVPVVIAALQGTRVVGTAIVHPHLKDLYAFGMDARTLLQRTSLTRLCVDPTLRGQGIGDGLLAVATATAERDGFRLIYGLSEGGSGTTRRRLYHRHGYQTGPQGTPPPSPPEVFGDYAPWVHGTRRGFHFWRLFGG